MGWTLPVPTSGAGNYLPYRRTGNLLYLAGTISTRMDGTLITGKAGADKTLEDAYAAAQVCAVNQLGAMKAALGSLEAVRQVLTVNGYVNVVPDFIDVPQVINGASDFTAAATATARMVDFLSTRWDLSPENTYVLCSATMSLRLSQVVNRPMTTVTAALPKDILPTLPL